MLRDAEQIVRFWRAVEVFSPQPLPGANVRDNVTDVRPGDPMPWQAGARLAERQPAAGKVWRHHVFGGLFELSRVRDALLVSYERDEATSDRTDGDRTDGDLAAGGDPADGSAPSEWAGRGQSALFACVVGADGVLAGDVAVSRCARVLGDIVAGAADAIAGAATAGGGDPLTGQRTADEAGALARRPLSADDLRKFTADLAERLGVAALLGPSGLRVRSYQVPADSPGGADAPGQLLASSFDGDLAQVADALRAGNGGAVLAAFLGSGATDRQEDGGREHGGGATDRQEDGGREDGGREDVRVDVRREPLAVRDGCAPGRIPPGRWVADEPLARSEQFAVNEIMRCPGLSAVHAPAGTGTAAVFSDLVAAIVVERGRRLAELPSPAAAFGAALPWGSHPVRPPVPALAGFEIVLAAPEGDAGLAEAGARWRDRAAEADYFPSTARLADSDGTWALVSARLGDRADRRAFVERFWHGTVRGTDVLFRAGESMPAALRRLTNEAVDWPAAVARFRTALARVSALSSERTVVAAALARLSLAEQACEEASCALEAARQRCTDLTQREQRVRDALVAAEEHRRARLADLAARGRRRQAPTAPPADAGSGGKERTAPEAAPADPAASGNKRSAPASTPTPADRAASGKERSAAAAPPADAGPGGRPRTAPPAAPADTAAGGNKQAAPAGKAADAAARGRERRSLASLLARRLRAGRDWVGARAGHRALRAACEDATRQRDEALREQQALRADLASARQAVAAAEAAQAALAAELARLQEPVTQARQRWGDQVPDGPSQAETEDAALIERRETSPAWGDEEYAAARTELFLAALALHKALITAEAETFERNLGALMDRLSGDLGQPPSPEVALAAWQSFFLVVPVARVAGEGIGSLLAGLGRGSVGWLLAASAGTLAPQQVLGALWRANRAVLAGDARRDGPTVMLPRSGQHALAKALGIAGDWVPGHTSAQRLADRTARYGTWLPAGPHRDRAWVGAPLRVRRDAAPPAGERDDGLLVFGTPERAALISGRRPALNRKQLPVRRAPDQIVITRGGPCPT